MSEKRKNTKQKKKKNINKKSALKKAQQKKRTKRTTAPYVHKSKSGKRTRDGLAKMRMIPLGGLDEVGKNMTVFEYKDQAIIVDCGLMFPDDDMLGVDIVLPDYDYVRKNKDKIKGLIVTHGHEDHIGGIPYLLKEANIPIYTTKFTRGLIERKLKEHNLPEKPKYTTIEAGKKFKLGEFEIEPIHVNHSIVDSVALAIFTPAATVIHTGDFKVDYQPIDGEIIDLQRFAELGAEGVDLLLADSTNVEENGFTPSESSVGETFLNVFRNNKNRIIVTTFASNVHRIQQIFNAAVEYNRKVAVIGRSMENIVDVALELGYLDVPPKTYIKTQDMDRYKPEELVVITTGSQGEPMAALARMAKGEHPFLNITDKDTIVISASPVPGNEKMVSSIINQLVSQGAEVIYKKVADTHVSGHGSKEELKLMQALVKPHFFIPVHGESRMLKHHANLAQELGMPPENVFLLSNGDQFEFDKRSAKIVRDTFSSQPILVDGLGIGDIGNIVLNDRKRLSEDGLFIVVQKMHNSKPIGYPDIISRGFVYVKENEALIERAKNEVMRALRGCQEKKVTEWSDIKHAIRNSMQKFLYKQTERNPMILPILISV